MWDLLIIPHTSINMPLKGIQDNNKIQIHYHNQCNISLQMQINQNNQDLNIMCIIQMGKIIFLLMLNINNLKKEKMKEEDENF